MKTPVTVAITGAAGQIGYQLCFRIAAGDMLGPDQPVVLKLQKLPVQGATDRLRTANWEILETARLWDRPSLPVDPRWRDQKNFSRRLEVTATDLP